MTRETCLAAAVDAVLRARGFTDDVEFSAEDATRSDLDFLCRVVESVIDAGATTINLPDTVGYSTPDEIARVLPRRSSRACPNSDRAIFSAHCHDDLGLAVANTLAAIGAGARQVECTINGIGERAGNASLEEIVMATRVRPDRVPVETTVVTRELYPSSQLLTELTGERVQANKAIVGRNAFAHEAGIHQDGMLKDRRTYEIMRPEDVGVPKTTLVLGTAFRPARGPEVLRADGTHACRVKIWTKSTGGWSRSPTTRKSCPTTICSRSPRPCAEWPSPGPSETPRPRSRLRIRRVKAGSRPASGRRHRPGRRGSGGPGPHSCRRALRSHVHVH